MSESFLSKVAVFQQSIWGLHLPVPAEIAAKFVDGNFRRVQCTLNGVYKMHAALMPDHGSWYVLLNKAVCRELRLEIGSTVSVTFEKETSEYGMPMPDELHVCLDQELNAFEYFQNLTPGKQRSLIYIVSKMKNVDSRIRKGIAIAEHLSENKGVLDFKRLNIKIKEVNNRLI